MRHPLSSFGVLPRRSPLDSNRLIADIQRWNINDPQRLLMNLRSENIPDPYSGPRI